ncbi:MAG: DUF3168 domain-containing protein [Pontixanthobacter sp.]
MEHRLRAALLAWLRADPALANALNAIEEENPSRATAPWLGIAASASTDWSMKDRRGREVRLALELQTRGDDPAGDAALINAIERRIVALPGQHSDFHCVTVQFLRARAERRSDNRRAALIECRFRLLEISTE